jgi:hypothetical protein
MAALNALKWIVILFAGIFILRALLGSGGLATKIPSRSSSSISSEETRGGSSISQGENDETPDGTIETEGYDSEEVEINIADIKGSFKRVQNLINSEYADIVTISSYSRAKKKSVDEERIEIKVKGSTKEKISITNWRLESSVTGKGDSIEGGSYLPYSSQVNFENVIALESGDKAIIITGRSPIGVSFRLNQCTGYFEQFQDFNPSLPRKCPDPVDDLPNLGVGDLANACFDFIDRLPRCQIYLKALPGNLGGSCLNYINQKINYNSCVDTHKDDINFYSNEWRIYLERDEELWRDKREIIKLIDHKGRVVDAVSY